MVTVPVCGQFSSEMRSLELSAFGYQFVSTANAYSCNIVVRSISLLFIIGK